MITRVNSRICKNSPYIWFLKFWMKIAITGMVIFGKIAKIIYWVNPEKSVNSPLFSFFAIFTQKCQFQLKMKILKFLGIQPVFRTFIRLIFGTQIEIQLAASASRPCCSRTAGPLGLISGFSTRKTDNWKPSVVVTLSSRHEYPWSLIISGTDKWLSSGISFSIVKLNSVAELTLNRLHSEVILVQKSGYFRWKISQFFISHVWYEELGGRFHI